jgi:acyl carrier protein
MSTNIIRIKEWLISKSSKIKNFDNDFNIIEKGVIDSLQFLELIYLIEHLSGQEINMLEISIADFTTLNRIESKFFTKDVEIQ